MEITNLDKVYWPDQGYTKRDLIEYYQTIAPFILPYLKNRPVMLHRYPNGITGQEFYQKDSSSLHLPKGIQTVLIPHKEKPLKYILIQNISTLIYVINLGVIEIHSFFTRAKYLEHPDYCMFDLDPVEISFDHVVNTALEIHELLETIGIKNYCKTSGKKGLHIYVPLGKKYPFEQIKYFTQIIALFIHKKYPKYTSVERNPENRRNKVYIDVGQNNHGQTSIAPYSVRGIAFAPVSTPLEWKEVNSKLHPVNFTIKTVPERVKKKGDLFKPVLQSGVDLPKALNKLEKITVAMLNLALRNSR